MASSLLFVLACLLPTKAKVYDPLDESWMEALHSAFVNHLQFGRDMVYTYGPWGFLFGGYWPATHLLSILMWLALGIIFWIAGRRLACASFQNEFARWLWLMFVTALTTAAAFPNLDARLICFPLFLIALHFFDKKEFATLIQGAVVVALGLLSLVKFTLLIISVVFIALIAVDTLWRQRRFPWITLLYVASIFLFWLLAGQHLSSFVPYLRNSFQISSGYTEAMAVNNTEGTKYIGWFVLVTLMMFCAATFAIWRRLRFFGLLPLGALGFVTFIVFKHGFVRDDHQPMASVLLLQAALVCFAIFWPAFPERKWWLWAAGFLPVAAGCVFTDFSFRHFEASPLTKQLAEAVSPKKWLAPIRLLYDRADWQKSWEQYLSSYRDLYPMPPLKGDVDFYSWNQMPIFAYGLPYRPRPIPQSFSAYTPHLARLNADHLKSDKAASTIVFDGVTIDQRYLSLDDGLSWPELLTRYDIQEVEIPFVVLKRSAAPRKFTLTLLRETFIKFGEQFSLPTNGGTLWAEIEIDHTLAGSLVSALFKPPSLELNTTLRNGQQRADRFIPEMARSGFILSPCVTDCSSFLTLASDSAPPESRGNEVASFNIASAAPSSPNTSYKNSIRIRLYRLDYPKQNLEKAEGYLQIVHLKEILTHAAVSGPGQWFYVPEAGSVVGVAPGTSILVERPKQSTRLKVGFGLYLRGGHPNLNGITFTVSTVNEKQQAVRLWNRRIDPRTTPGDRGVQQAVVDLKSSESQRILLTAVPDRGSTNMSLCPYWSEMRFEAEQ